jgi:CubicO group peptidase (beta-lactamase class C family)
MFTAIGTMQLVQDGKVQLDAPVGNYVDDLPQAWRRVTVRQLLAHTSGINSFTSHDTMACGEPARAQENYRQQDVIAEVSCLPLDFEPGKNWSYSDTGYFVLGLLIERVSGLKYDEYLRQRIFKPLGMHSTRLMGPMGVDDGRATGYAWQENHLTPAPLLSPVVEGPSGGLVSNVLDLAKFNAALGDDRLLPQAVFQSMWQPTGIGTAKYGLGFALRPIKGRRQVGHTGGGPGAATSFARFVDDDLTVVVLTNTAQPPQTIQEIVGGIAELVLQPPALH